jgi:hypothetical protein
VLNQCARLLNSNAQPGAMPIEVLAICFTASVVAYMASQPRLPSQRTQPRAVERRGTEVARTYACHAVKPLCDPADTRKKIGMVVTFDTAPRSSGPPLPSLFSPELSAFRQPPLRDRWQGEPLALGHGPRVGECWRRLRRFPRQHGSSVGVVGEA